MTQEWIKALDLEKKLYHPYFEEEERFLKEELKSGMLIDLGCGEGRISRQLQGLYTHYTGIDIDQEVVDKLNRNTPYNVSYQHGNVCKLDLENGSFDTALCMTTYANFGKNLTQMLQETSRILQDDGVFIGSCYHEEALDKRLELYSRFGDIIKSINEHGHVTFKEGMETEISCQYTKNQIKEQLKNAGFYTTRIEKSGPFYLFKGIKR